VRDDRAPDRVAEAALAKPWALWLNRYRAAALVLANKKEEARHSLATFSAPIPT